MKCGETIGLLSDRLKGLLEPGDERRLREHIAACDACRKEAEAVEELWNDMDAGGDHVPHERMRARFHAALAAYEQATTATALDRIVQYMGQRHPALQLGGAMAILVVGIILGRVLPGQMDDDIVGLRQDIRAISLALLDHQSAAERLRGVEWAQRMAPSSAALVALLDVARNDRNENVRLAAIEALGQRLDRPEVGAALVEVLMREQAPLMQVTLADVLLRSGVDGSVAAVETLVEREGIDPSVQDYLRTTVREPQEDRPGGELL
jgi:hypothetical protein